MASALDEKPEAMTTLHRWPDPMSDWGHDPLGDYGERFWLPVLGPTPFLLMRWLTRALPAPPEDSVSVNIYHACNDLHAPNQRVKKAFARLHYFSLVSVSSSALSAVAVRETLPTLAAEHLVHLRPERRAEHGRWLAAAEDERTFWTVAADGGRTVVRQSELAGYLVRSGWLDAATVEGVAPAELAARVAAATDGAVTLTVD